MKEYTYKYPRPALTVDLLITRNIENRQEVLLIQRLNSPFKNFWALPGGFVDMDETLEQAATRELSEETGLLNVELVQFKAYSTVDRDPRGRTVSVVFTGQVEHYIVATAGDDAKNAGWFNVLELPTLAFDHEIIINEALINLMDNSKH